MSILITRPNFDATTRYLHAWAGKIKSIAEKKGIKVLDLENERATKKIFDSMLKAQKPSVIFFNGHGDENCIAGHENERLIEKNKDSHLLAYKIIYAVACKSAKYLGPKAIESDAKCFVGYSQDFAFFHQNEKLSRPLEDEIAAIFLEPSNYFMASLIKGHTTAESFERSHKSFLDNIRAELTSESKLDHTALGFLFWDYKYQTFLGDKNAKI